MLRRRSNNLATGGEQGQGQAQQEQALESQATFIVNAPNKINDG